MPQPFCFSSNDTGCYEDIISKAMNLLVRLTLSSFLHVHRVARGRLRSQEGEAYKSREPGPYCPDTGQAHTTCKASPVALVAGGFRAIRVFSSEAKGSAGMTSRGRQGEGKKGKPMRKGDHGHVHPIGQVSGGAEKKFRRKDVKMAMLFEPASIMYLFILVMRHCLRKWTIVLMIDTVRLSM
jgi:hypothetical protein